MLTATSIVELDNSPKSAPIHLAAGVTGWLAGTSLFWAGTLGVVWGLSGLLGA